MTPRRRSSELPYSLGGYDGQGGEEDDDDVAHYDVVYIIGYPPANVIDATCNARICPVPRVEIIV